MKRSGRFVKKIIAISTLYLVLMSLIPISFSVDLPVCIDTVRRNLMLITLGA